LFASLQAEEVGLGDGVGEGVGEGLTVGIAVVLGMTVVGGGEVAGGVVVLLVMDVDTAMDVDVELAGGADVVELVGGDVAGTTWMVYSDDPVPAVDAVETTTSRLAPA
jgi:hypothetical protein